MFTLDQINLAHQKVKSGADFPSYIQEIKTLGVARYSAFVADGHVDYYGTDGSLVSAPKKYESLKISEKSTMEVFKKELIAHQQGKTDYPTFLQMCAETGIEKWEICLDKMTCTYFDKTGNIVLKERIPGANN